MTSLRWKPAADYAYVQAITQPVLSNRGIKGRFAIYAYLVVDSAADVLDPVTSYKYKAVLVEAKSKKDEFLIELYNERKLVREANEVIKQEFLHI